MAVAAVLSAVRRPRSPRLLTDSSDEQLARGAAAGDEAAFAAIYDRYAAGLLAFCRQLLGSPEEAEDALQQSLVRAYSALRAGRAPSCLKAWLYAIARNRCLTSLAARRVVVDLEAVGGEVAPADDCYVEVQRRADVGDLVDDLRRLPDDQRVALVLFELGGHSQRDIAEVLGVAPVRVKALVFQAREGLARARQARTAACRDVLEELAMLRGAAPRRGPLADHLARCDACAAFAAEVTRQRRALAVVILPAVPPVALKAKVLGTALTGGGGAAVAVGGTGAAGGVAVVGGGAGVGGGAVAVAGAGGAGVLGAGAAATAGVGGLATVGAGGVAAGLAAKGVVAKILTAVALAGSATATGAPASRPVSTAAPSSIAPIGAGRPVPKTTGPADEQHAPVLPSSAPGPADQPPAAAPAPAAPAAATPVAVPAAAATPAPSTTTATPAPDPAPAPDTGGAEAAPPPADPAPVVAPDAPPADTSADAAAAAPVTTDDSGAAQPADPVPADPPPAGGAEPAVESP